MSHTSIISEQDRPTLHRWQAIQAAGKIGGADVETGQRVLRGWRRQVAWVQLGLAPSTLAPQMIQGHAPGDDRHPGQGRAQRGVVMVRFAPDAHEAFLKDILGRVAPPHQPQAQAEQRRRRSIPDAAERGLVDAVIDPADTRREVAAAFEMLATKRERLAARKHDNTPL